MKSQFTISGYRGIWGETFTPTIAEELAHAYARFVLARRGTRILIGRAARESGEQVVHTVAETLRDAGLSVTIGGLLPTPTVLFLVRKLSFDGAIIVTASHNPEEYNGLKFVTSRGLFLSEKEILEMKKYLNEETPLPKKVDSHKITLDKNLGGKHVDHILSHIDINLVRDRKFTVVLDPINSAGALLTPDLLRRLGCEVHVINGDTSEPIAHPPEPIHDNLISLEEEVTRMRADIGFAQDPDADRLVVCNEWGEIISEEYTLALSIMAALEKHPPADGDIVINMSSSKMNEDIARSYGGKTWRTKVGEANVVHGIMEHKAIVGGEGSGGVIYPAINLCRDSLTGIAIILELLAKKRMSVSKLVNSLPRYFMRKAKFLRGGDLETVYKRMSEKFPDAETSTLDGLRLDFPDGAWIHLRPSNTEPIIRLIGEAKTRMRIDELFKQVEALVQ